MALAQTALAPARRRTENRFFAALALLLILYLLIGFWQSYVGAGMILAPLPSLLVHIHAALFVGWIVLLTAQIALIGIGRVAVHRRLGQCLAWWAAAMVVIGPATVIMAVRRPESGIGAPILAGDFAQTIAFVILIGAGLAHRRHAALHKRLMLLASAAIIGPALARWPFDFIRKGPPIGLAVLYLLPPVLLIGYDLATRRRVYGVTWLGLLLMVLVLASFLVFPAWSVWQDFTHWVQTV